MRKDACRRSGAAYARGSGTKGPAALPKDPPRRLLPRRRRSETPLPSPRPPCAESQASGDIASFRASIRPRNMMAGVDDEARSRRRAAIRLGAEVHPKKLLTSAARALGGDCRPPPQSHPSRAGGNRQATSRYVSPECEIAVKSRGDGLKGGAEGTQMCSPRGPLISLEDRVPPYVTSAALRPRPPACSARIILGLVSSFDSPPLVSDLDPLGAASLISPLVE